MGEWDSISNLQKAYAEGAAEERARLVEALLSYEAVNAAACDDGHGAECCVEEMGGCGGTHTECY